MKQIWTVGILILACLVVGGCETESERLANMADRTVAMQSQQNSTIARTTSELVGLNRDVQSERKILNQGFRQLERDRRDIHKQRRSELAWAESVQFMSIVIAASLPLFLCAYLVWAAMNSPDDKSLINEVLMQELVANKPRLIAGPNRPAGQRTVSLNDFSGSERSTKVNRKGQLNNVTHLANQN